MNEKLITLPKNCDFFFLFIIRITINFDIKGHITFGDSVTKFP